MQCAIAGAALWLHKGDLGSDMFLHHCSLRSVWWPWPCPSSSSRATLCCLTSALLVGKEKKLCIVPLHSQATCQYVQYTKVNPNGSRSTYNHRTYLHAHAEQLYCVNSTHDTFSINIKFHLNSPAPCSIILCH